MQKRFVKIGVFLLFLVVTGYYAAVVIGARNRTAEIVTAELRSSHIQLALGDL